MTNPRLFKDFYPASCSSQYVNPSRCHNDADGPEVLLLLLISVCLSQALHGGESYGYDNDVENPEVKPPTAPIDAPPDGTWAARWFQIKKMLGIPGYSLIIMIVVIDTPTVYHVKRRLQEAF